MSDGSDTERTPEQVRAEIEQTREELGETVEALAAKTDVKAQARQTVDDTKANVNERVSEIRSSIGDRAVSAQQAAPRSLTDAGGRASALIRENRPAAIALGALALGVLIGRRRSS